MNTNRHIAWLWIAVLMLSVTLLLQLTKPTPLPHKTDFRYAEPPKPQPPVHKLGDPETAPSGFIREINWQKRLIMYESDYGYMRILGPICPDPDLLPVWRGEHVYQINFRWIPWNNDTGVPQGGCYVLDWVGHDPARDLHIVPQNGVTK